MKEPRKFPAVLTGVMAGLLGKSNQPVFGNARVTDHPIAYYLVLFGGAGALAYLTFGDEIQTVVLVNLDTENKMVQAVSKFPIFSFTPCSSTL